MADLFQVQNARLHHEPDDPVVTRFQLPTHTIEITSGIRRDGQQTHANIIMHVPAIPAKQETTGGGGPTKRRLGLADQPK